MCKRKWLGFTLLELMVTIMIMAILLAVSGPVYISYTVKSKFAEVFATMEQYKDDMETAYTDNGYFPTTLYNLTSGTYNAVTSDVLQQIYYGVGSSTQTAYLQFFTLNLGVSGYVQSNTSGSGGVSARVTLAAVINATGDTQFYCGQWDGSSMDVPLSYLPQGCQDTNISALIT
jgi:prepilin-type N-terminal cleavage/methylation domain-containing protein